MSPDQAPMTVTIIEWRPVAKATLRGFATVRLGSLLIRDVSVHRTGERPWAALPSKPSIDSRTGSARRDEQGKIVYVPVLHWETRAASDRFQAGLLAALETAYPGATR